MKFALKLGIPKYQKIVFSIEKVITRGHLKKGNQIPTINSVKNKHSISRDTVLMVFNKVKSIGVLHAAICKGHYTTSICINTKKKVLLFFDQLNSFKKNLHKGYINHLGDSTEAYIYFSNFNHHVFSKIMEYNICNYNNYAIKLVNLYRIGPTLKKLLHIIKKIRVNKLSLTEYIVSCKYTLLKEIVEGGITTISTDFTVRGKRLSEMIQNNKHKRIENPNQPILRNSL